MRYETWTKEKGEWNSTETWFNSEEEAYNYLVRVVNAYPKVEAIRITDENGETKIEEEL